MLFKKENVKFFLLPGVVGLLISLYFLLWNLFDLPEYKELIGILQGVFDRYGLWVVLVASIIEGALLVGNYLPGGLAIFLAVISVGNNPVKLALIVVLTTAGFFIANMLNYVLGRYGWYHVLIKFGLQSQLIDAETKWKSKSFKVIFLSYWQANLAALTATAAGVLKINFKKFVTEVLISLVFWNIMWTLLVYFLREHAVNAVTNVYIIFALAVLWALYTSVRKYRESVRI